MRAVTILGVCLALGLSGAASAQTRGNAEDALLEQVRTGQIGNRVDERRQVQAFSSSPAKEQQTLLREARERRDALLAESQQLEEVSRRNDKVYKEKISALRTEMGPNAGLFGTLQQTATDLIGLFRNSSTSLEYPQREAWLAEFLQRMEKSSEIFSIEELEKIWFLLQQEITASGKIVALQTEVLGESGHRDSREVVRDGKFALISNDPEPAYLTWDASSQRASMLKRQPEGTYLAQADNYLEARG